MILFVFEGERERKWFRPISHFYLKDEVVEYYIVGTTFHLLYKKLVTNEWDIVGTLKQIDYEKGDSRLANYNSSDFAEIFLFFDYDPHSRNGDIHLLNEELGEMLAFFDNETTNGKMYVNYPMIEALRYTKELPDENFYTYICPVKDCGKFKQMAANFCAYSGTSFLTARDKQATLKNWEMLKLQNVMKANYICCEDNNLPVNKKAISQKAIFTSQVTKFVNTDFQCVAILSAFAIFLYDYFK